MIQTQTATAPTQAPVAVQVPANPTPQQVYRALRDQRDILGDQLRQLTNERDDISRELANPSTPSAVKPGLEKRLTQVDARIAGLDQQIAQSDAAVAQAAGVPGATVQPPRPPQTGPDPDMVAGLTFVVVLVFAIPISIAYARRIWRKSARTEVTLPPEMAQRMESLERGVEAIALEVERIGEGQRFLTQAMADRVSLPAGGRPADPLPARNDPNRR